MTDFAREFELKLFIDGKEKIPGNEGEIDNANGHLVHDFNCDQQLDKPDMLTFSLQMMRQNEFLVLDKLVPGMSVKLVAGNASPGTLFEGEVVKVVPKFSPGKNILEVVCYSKLWRLTMGNNMSRFYGDGHEASVTPSSILSDVVNNSGAHNGGGDGLSVSTGSSSAKLEYASQVGMNDFQFLSQVVGANGFSMRGGSSASEVVLKPVELGGSAKIKVFRDRVDAGDTNFGCQKAEFSNSVVGMYKQVWVRGYDHQAMKGFVGKAEAPSALIGGKSGVLQTGKFLWGSESDGKVLQVIDCPVGSEDEAKEVAQAFLDRFTRRWMLVRASIEGYSALRPGDVAEFTNFGTRFSGNYLITSCQHVWSAGSGKPYSTFMTGERNASPPKP